LASVAISGVGALVTVVVPVAAAASWDPTADGLLEVVPLLGLAASPYVGLVLLALVLRRSVLQRVVAFAAALALTVWGVAGVVDAFVVRPDVLSGLVLWGVAATQWAGVVIAWTVSLLDAVARRVLAASAARRS
jgi:phosphatidylglycerophosphate synthase